MKLEFQRGGGVKIESILCNYIDLTLCFPESEKETIDNYLKKIGGRRYLEEKILKEAKEQEGEQCHQ